MRGQGGPASSETELNPAVSAPSGLRHVTPCGQAALCCICTCAQCLRPWALGGGGLDQVEHDEVKALHGYFRGLVLLA